MTSDRLPWQIAFIGSVLSLITFLAFLWSFLRIPQKNYGFYMILILTVADLSQPIVKILTIFFTPKSIPVDIIGPVTTGVESFKLYWTAVFSLYTYLVYRCIIRRKVFHFKTFILVSLVICGLLTSISILALKWLDINYVLVGEYTFAYEFADDYLAIVFFGIRDIIGRLIPIIMTRYCYYYVYKYLCKSLPESASKENITKRVLYYSSLPIICFVPSIFQDLTGLYCTLTNTWENPMINVMREIFGIVNPLLRYAWEFLNLYFYWVLLPNDNKSSILIQEDELGNSLESENNQVLFTGKSHIRQEL